MFSTGFGTLCVFLLRLVPWVVYSAYSQQVAAQSISALSEKSLDLIPREGKSPYPSLKACRKALTAGMPPKDKAIFWTGTSGSLEAFSADLHFYTVANDLISVSSWGVWDKPDFLELSKYENNPAKADAFIHNFNQAFTESAQGRAYLVMPYGMAPPERSVFWRTEWPVIQREGKVSEIVWIDARWLYDNPVPPKKKEFKRLWWKRGDQNPATYPGQDLAETLATLPKKDAEEVQAYISLRLQNMINDEVKTFSEGVRPDLRAAITIFLRRLLPREREEKGPGFIKEFFRGFASGYPKETGLAASSTKKPRKKKPKTPATPTPTPAPTSLRRLTMATPTSTLMSRTVQLTSSTLNPTPTKTRPKKKKKPKTSSTPTSMSMEGIALKSLTVSSTAKAQDNEDENQGAGAKM